MGDIPPPPTHTQSLLVSLSSPPVLSTGPGASPALLAQTWRKRRRKSCAACAVPRGVSIIKRQTGASGSFKGSSTIRRQLICS